MTTTSVNTRLAAGLAGLAARRPVERACYLVAAALVASGVAHLGVWAVDGGPVFGPVSWRKPVTFGLSFGTTLASITWVSSYLRLAPRVRAALLGVFAVDCVVEVLGITVQAWRGVPSHFDTETPADSVVAFSLATGGAVLVSVLGAMAVTAFRGRVDGPPSMRLALRAGFGLLVAGLASGAAMIARGESLIRAGHTDAAYHDAGFAKWFHGVTLHGVLVLPALAWWLSRLPRSEESRTRTVAFALGGYLVAAAAVLAVSLARL